MYTAVQLPYTHSTPKFSTGNECKIHGLESSYYWLAAIAEPASPKASAPYQVSLSALRWRPGSESAGTTTRSTAPRLPERTVRAALDVLVDRVDGTNVAAERLDGCPEFVDAGTSPTSLIIPGTYRHPIVAPGNIIWAERVSSARP